MATDFGDLCNIRLAPGGVYANVLPLTAAHAGTWQGWRSEIEKDFQNIAVIANTSKDELQSMSADTGMSEMLVVATKKERRPSVWTPTEILCVNLSKSPTTMAEGYATAREIAAIPPESEQGTLTHGIYTRMRQEARGNPWGAVGNSNNEMNNVIEALLRGEAHDPLTLTTYQLSVPTATLGETADTGPTHHLIGHATGNDPIGAFEWVPLDKLASKPAQQSMWAADAKSQTRITTSPTHGGTPVDQELSKEMVKNRSKWFISRNLRWTSQATAVSRTTKPAHGGRAWNAMQKVSDNAGQCIALYYNSTIGAIVRNAYGQSTQAGRAPIQIGSIPGLPYPAFHADTPEAQRARDIANRNFGQLSCLPLEPFAYCFRDTNRHKIDSVVAEMLGLDPQDEAVKEMLAYYRLLFASEPNVNGRQKKIMEALENHGQSDGEQEAD